MIKNQLLFIGLLFFFITACKNTKNDRTAIGPISFGIKSSEFKIAIDSFKLNLEKHNSNTYKLGSFLFKNIHPVYQGDSLVRLRLDGELFEGYNVFSEVYNLTHQSLTEKYGEPLDYYSPREIKSGDIGNFKGSLWFANEKKIELNFNKSSSSSYEMILEVYDFLAEGDKEFEDQKNKKEESNKIKEII